MEEPESSQTPFEHFGGQPAVDRLVDLLRARHLPFPIGDAERDAWLLCMNGAIDAVIPASPVREEVRAAVIKLADWMRNRPQQAPG